MGKASRAKRDRGPRRSRADLLEALNENVEFLERSSGAFDEGFESEAKRLAVVLRVLLHDTEMSHSLLEQLGVKRRLDFLDTAQPIDPKNLANTPGLLMMRATWTGDGGVQGDYVAPLGMERPFPPRISRFTAWWDNPVMKVDGTWSRKQLVLILANREGGAHIDPSLDERYEALARRNGLGWRAVGSGQSDPFVGNAVSLAVRQVAYEVLETLHRNSHRVFGSTAMSSDPAVSSGSCSDKSSI